MKLLKSIYVSLFLFMQAGLFFSLNCTIDLFYQRNENFYPIKEVSTLKSGWFSKIELAKYQEIIKCFGLLFSKSDSGFVEQFRMQENSELVFFDKTKLVNISEKIKAEEVREVNFKSGIIYVIENDSKTSSQVKHYDILMPIDHFRKKYYFNLNSGELMVLEGDGLIHVNFEQISETSDEQEQNAEGKTVSEASEGISYKKLAGIASLIAVGAYGITSIWDWFTGNDGDDNSDEEAMNSSSTSDSKKPDSKTEPKKESEKERAERLKKRLAELKKQLSTKK